MTKDKAKDSFLSQVFQVSRQEAMIDYEMAILSRQMSIIGRKEVLSGKAKFGILGDGKEIPQLALAKVVEMGDFRSGYYRDQTLMMALGLLSPEQFFAQLYAHPDIHFDPHSAGRQMNAHFSTHSIDENGKWLNLTQQKNSAADISCTAGQMPRAVGLALASRLYRHNEALSRHSQNYSTNGKEICFVTIGDASTSEGLFWEAVNAAGVQKIPMAINIWDDGYGISVPREFQTTKGSISELIKGFEINESGNGYLLGKALAWDYVGLIKMYRSIVPLMRETHNPAIFHIEEVTQPQGHSTSGSHERYKSKERLQWERDFDCITKMREWMIAEKIASDTELTEVENTAIKTAQQACKSAWKNFSDSIYAEIIDLRAIYQNILASGGACSPVEQAIKNLDALINPTRRDMMENLHHTLLQIETSPQAETLLQFYTHRKKEHQHLYSSHLYSESVHSALSVPVIDPLYEMDAPLLNGYEIINHFFDKALEQDPLIVAFGEDVGQIGDVNQGFAGLQKKYGPLRVFDTGIREATIMGQGIGLAMRGFRPIAEIQYLDYLLYGLQTLSDDLATLHYRSAGRQKAPLIVRTRGHRLEGIWHTGSPMGMLLHALRGIYILVPRNMTQAAGFYCTMLQSDDPAIIIECLNGYRLKEKLPSNLGQFTIPLGVPEILKEGKDITLVTYGACVRIAAEAVEKLGFRGICVELIDVQTLLPFDIYHILVKSLQKTSRILFLDEDVPGGATAFMMQEVLEVQKGYQYLDTAPRTLTARAHRGAYGSDGDYYCKPQCEDVIDAVIEMMKE